MSTPVLVVIIVLAAILMALSLIGKIRKLLACGIVLAIAGLIAYFMLK